MANAKSKAKVLWVENADGSWTGTENCSIWPRRWHLVKNPNITHRTSITMSVDASLPPSRMDKPSFESAKRYVARWMPTR
jgi:hypothetical protein